MPFAPDTTPAQRRRVVFVLLAAVTAISTAAVLVRSIEQPPVAVAFWRTLGVGLLLLPLARPVHRHDAVRIGLAGLCLAAHFGAWFASIHQTTVLRSTVLVCSAPLWTALWEWTRHGHRPSPHWFAGLLAAVLGAGVLSEGAGSATLAGDALALLGGVLAAAYLTLGQQVRARVPIQTYASLVCLAAAAWLAPAAWATGALSTPPTSSDVFLLLALAAGPQLIGHNGLNYALRWLPASSVATLTLLEPAGAALWAWLLLDESPTGRGIAGASLIVCGVAGAIVSTDRGMPTAEA